MSGVRLSFPRELPYLQAAKMTQMSQHGIISHTVCTTRTVLENSRLKSRVKYAPIKPREAVPHR